MHDEDDTLNVSPMRQNSIAYTREENNWGNDSGMFLPDDGGLCDTVMADNTELRSNNIPERIDSVL